VRIGGRRGADPASETEGAPERHRVPSLARPALGLAVISPLVFVGAVSAAAPQFHAKPMTSVHAVITPVASVQPAGALAGADMSGPVVIAIQRPPTAFHVASATNSAPPPPTIVNAPGALGIPIMALTAYRNAEQKMAAADPACGVSWNLLAGIGRIESMHANGGAVDQNGTAVNPIYGPALDGTLPGNEVIIQGGSGNRVTYARAMGPMQFLPGTWARYASDGDGDGIADPQNLFDSTLAAARYLCSGGLNLRDSAGVMAAILRYNNSVPYAQNVLGWAAAYATGVVPVDLPPIVGPPPPIGDMHLEHPEGLGPDLPMNVNGLNANDPMSHMPLIDFGPPMQMPNMQQYPWMQGAQGTAPWMQGLPPWMQPQQQQPPAGTPQPGCTLICISSNGPDGSPAPATGPMGPASPPVPNGGIVIAPPAAPAPPPFAPPPPDPLAPPAPPVAPPPAPAAPAPASPAPAAPAHPHAGAPAATPAPKPAGPSAAPAPAPGPGTGEMVVTPVS
jgi:membrane-bound lytic murein transglycosylase B